MEQNDYSTTGSQSQSGSSGSSGSLGASSNTSTNEDQSLTDRARDFAGSAQDRLADVGSTVRDRAGQMKDSLADALDSGADKLRSRASSGDLAGATDGGSMAIANDGRATQVADRVAGGMEATAGWLRDADLDGLRETVESQVKDHPGRTLLIAAGLGYLLGKAMRK